MRDVAAVANVSTKTVSNVLRGWPPVRTDTRERVQAALDQVGYRLNHAPKVLRTGRSGALAVAVPWLENPYFAELTSEIVRRAEDRGFTVIVDQTGGQRHRELAVVKGLRRHSIDGIIFSPWGLDHRDFDQASDVPMVLLGERVGAGVMDHVAIDNITAARAIVTHLIELGHRRIAVLGQQSIAPGEVTWERVRGYALALKDAGRQVDPMLQADANTFDRSAGARSMRRLLDLEHQPDAVFCVSDLLAVGAIHMIHEAGLRVPQDIAVAGFDNIKEGEFANPPLTTVGPEKGEVAEAALELLVSRLDDSAQPPRHISPRYEVVVRASSVAEDATRRVRPSHARTPVDEAALQLMIAPRGTPARHSGQSEERADRDG